MSKDKKNQTLTFVVFTFVSILSAFLGFMGLASDKIGLFYFLAFVVGIIGAYIVNLIYLKN